MKWWPSEAWDYVQANRRSRLEEGSSCVQPQPPSIKGILETSDKATAFLPSKTATTLSQSFYHNRRLNNSRHSSRAWRALGVGDGRDAPPGAALVAGRRRRADGDGRRADGRALAPAGEHDKVCGATRISSHTTVRKGVVVAYCRRCTAARSGRRWRTRWWRTRWRWAGRCRRRAGPSRSWIWWSCSTWPGRRGSWPPSGWCC